MNINQNLKSKIESINSSNQKSNVHSNIVAKNNRIELDKPVVKSNFKEKALETDPEFRKIEFNYPNGSHLQRSLRKPSIYQNPKKIFIKV